MVSFDVFQADYYRFIKEAKLFSCKYIKTMEKDCVIKQYHKFCNTFFNYYINEYPVIYQYVDTNNSDYITNKSLSLKYIFPKQSGQLIKYTGANKRQNESVIDNIMKYNIYILYYYYKDLPRSDVNNYNFFIHVYIQSIYCVYKLFDISMFSFLCEKTVNKIRVFIQDYRKNIPKIVLNKPISIYAPDYNILEGKSVGEAMNEHKSAVIIPLLKKYLEIHETTTYDSLRIYLSEELKKVTSKTLFNLSNKPLTIPTLRKYLKQAGFNPKLVIKRSGSNLSWTKLVNDWSQPMKILCEIVNQHYPEVTYNMIYKQRLKWIKSNHNG